jgi:hypothetical protein
MMNRNERMAKLDNAGIDTNKYFNLNLPNGLKPGATISLVINEDGVPEIVSGNCSENINNDYIAGQIISDGYVRNTKLHRRFVMAQMFHMLNYVSYRGEESGYNAYLKNMYGYDYTFKMMLDEVKVLSKLEVRDRESFEERVHFFDKRVVVAVMEDYMTKLKTYVDGLPNKNCKGVPYKRIKGVNIFNEDLNKKIYLPLEFIISYVRCARNYTEVHRQLERFMREMIKLPYNTAKSKVWIDTFKGEGAYYTLKNLIMFHDCVIKYGNYNEEVLTQNASMQELNHKLDEYNGEGWRMFALMKKVIKDNKFYFNRRMSEVYSR